MPKAIDIIPIANMFSSLSRISPTLFLGSLPMIIKLANLSGKNKGQFSWHFRKGNQMQLSDFFKTSVQFCY
jgi:hypothetical protein